MTPVGSPCSNAGSQLVLVLLFDSRFRSYIWQFFLPAVLSSVVLLGGLDGRLNFVEDQAAWPADPAVWPLDPAVLPLDTAARPLDLLTCGCSFDDFLVGLGGI